MTITEKNILLEFEDYLESLCEDREFIFEEEENKLLNRYFFMIY